MRLLGITIAIWLIFIVLLAGVSAYGSKQDSQLELLGIDTCNSHPCFMNITPGITQWDEAHRLSQIYNGQEDIDYIRIDFGSTHNLDIYIEKSDLDAVALVTIHSQTSDSNRLIAGEFIHKFGEPCLVGAASPNFFRLVYPSILVDVRVIRVFSPTSSVYNIHLGASAIDLCANRLNPLVMADWLGFSSADRYLTFLREKNQAGN
ncbi:MAG: hypothetical protein KF726_21505 [Anaerolineae bacterium]|nr:hypothetical protein [Anaerolineae bacterium]